MLQIQENLSGFTTALIQSNIYYWFLGNVIKLKQRGQKIDLSNVQYFLCIILQKLLLKFVLKFFTLKILSQKLQTKLCDLNLG